MDDVSRHLVTSSARLSPLEVLHASPAVLLGVSSEAVSVLGDLGVRTVFDLATSSVFGNATLLVEAGTDPRSLFARFGMAPSDIVETLPTGVTIDQLRFEDPRVLEGIGPAKAAAVSQGLGVRTVRDLALWPPYLAALDFLRTVHSPGPPGGADAEAPADLLPRSGEYPTERVHYTTLVFDGINARAADLTDLGDGVCVDVAPLLDPEEQGRLRPGVGALLTFAQSWFVQGVTLGNLLHSVALAPGESTRIAMLDWSRRTSAQQAEDVAETEQLHNVTEHSRALSEVTAAVAMEAQSGFSKSSVQSFSSQEGDSFGIGLGPVATLGGSDAEASSRSTAMSYASSAGRRDLSASMAQDIVDRTQQHANAARNRRATVVREVSQSEHQQVSTRVVTNYNHMHALSVHYYEVAQVYRVTVELTQVDKCLFLPMCPLDFTQAAVVRVFRPALARAALDAEARSLLATDLDTAEMFTESDVPVSPRGAHLVPFAMTRQGHGIQVPAETKLVDLYFMPDPTSVEVQVRLRDGTLVEVERRDNQNFTLRQTVQLHEIASLAIVNNTGNALDCLVAIGFTYRGVPFATDVQMPLTASRDPQILVRFTGGGVFQRLADHLMAHRLHYSQAVYRSLDPGQVTLLLSRYRFQGKPLVARVDPQPVTVAGNYLVFRMHVLPYHRARDGAEDGVRERAVGDVRDGGRDDEEVEWARWLDDHGISFDTVSDDLVPLPSGGVFAEAVLGRFNSAEKLDITRFWNWQDSPIPITPPEISAVQLESRRESEDLKPGNFSQPLVNIVNPTSLPDPQGISAVLQAVANGNMFRDMSGLASTVGLAQAGLQSATEGAIAAGTQAGSNMATAAKKEVEMFKAALAFVGSLYGGGSADTSPSTISNDGAKINHGRSLDARGFGGTAPNGGGTTVIGPAPGSGGSQGGTGAGPAGGAPASGGGTGPGGGFTGVPDTSNEVSGYQHALYGQRGQSDASMANLLLGFAAPNASTPPGGAPYGPGASPAGGLAGWQSAYASAVSTNTAESRMAALSTLYAPEVTLVNRTGDQSGTGALDPARLTAWDGRTVNYVDHLHEKARVGKGAAGHTLSSGGRIYVCAGARMLADGDWRQPVITLNHEFDHVTLIKLHSPNRGDDSELDTWGKTFQQDFLRHYRLEPFGGDVLVRMRNWSQPAHYYSRASAQTRGAFRAELRNWWSLTNDLEKRVVRIWLASGRQGGWAPEQSLPLLDDLNAEFGGVLQAADSYDSLRIIPASAAPLLNLASQATPLRIRTP